MRSKTVIASWNVNGPVVKTGHLKHFVMCYGVDVMLLNETHLRQDNRMKMGGIQYRLHRRDRNDGSGYGGVALLEIRYSLFNSETYYFQRKSISIQLEDGLVSTAAYNRPVNQMTQVS